MHAQAAATTTTPSSPDRYSALKLPELRNVTTCIYSIAVSTTKEAAVALYKDELLFALTFDALGAQLGDAAADDPSTSSVPRSKAAGQLGMLALCGDPGSMIDLMDALFHTARKQALPVSLRTCFTAEVLLLLLCWWWWCLLEQGPLEKHAIPC